MPETEHTPGNPPHVQRQQRSNQTPPRSLHTPPPLSGVQAVIDSTIPQDSSALGLKTKALRKCKRLKQCIDLHCCIERAYCISMGKLCWNYNGVSGSWGKDPACTASCKQPSIPGSLGLPSIDFHPGGHSIQIQSLLGRTRTNGQNEKAAANAEAKKQKQDAAQAEEWAASKQPVPPRAKEWKFSRVVGRSKRCSYKIHWETEDGMETERDQS